MLRYFQTVDYGDFSDNPYVVQRVRRYHDYKIWYDFEELTGQHRDLDGNFNDFKGVTQKALVEIVAHLEKVSQQASS